ncbi:helix-turn-helix domain-containing protein [Streptomyces niveus]|uniref:helix-turn-helix domain-containing protein n=1 Tax=Streptomyces niveus TaxID=193462 RepID=UPI00342EDBC3
MPTFKSTPDEEPDLQLAFSWPKDPMVYLDRLIARLPETLTVPTAMQTIADWLAQSLDAQVLLTTPDRALAAAPAAAGEHMARAILPQLMDTRSPDNPHTYLTPLATGSTTVLAVASPEPLDEHDERLIKHAAKLLGLVEQARRGIEALATSSATVSAVVQLLRDGETVKAGRIMRISGMPTDLLDCALARVFIIDTPPARRESALQRIEAATAGRALVSADPDDERRSLVIHPVQPGQADTVADTLTRLLPRVGPGATLGGSGVYAVDRIGPAYEESLRSLRIAGHQPTAAEPPSLAGLLPQRDAELWARERLAPILSLTEAECDQLLNDHLPVILRYSQQVAAEQLRVHRNTIRSWLGRTERLLNADLTRIADRAAVLLALEVLQRTPGITKFTAVPDDADDVPTLAALLRAPAAEAWAENLLSAAVAEDKYPLLETATVWLDCDAHIGRASSELGTSDNTVRKYLRKLGEHTARDLQSFDGVRDLLYAVEIYRGKNARSAAAALIVAA